VRLSYAEENWAGVAAEVLTLAGRHWSEMPFDANIPLALDYSLYDQLAAAGRLHVTTARCDDTGDNILVGYFVCFLGRHPHYDVLVASMDVYFMAPEFRGPTDALGLFVAMERLVRSHGVRYLLATARLDRQKNASRLFDRLGWKLVRSVFEKRLKD
jgi:hypothetical protein